jgi:hypothetical protein
VSARLMSYSTAVTTKSVHVEIEFVPDSKYERVHGRKCEKKIFLQIVTRRGAYLHTSECTEHTLEETEEKKLTISPSQDVDTPAEMC